MSTASSKSRPRTSKSTGEWLSNHWLEIFLVVYGLWVFIPFLAPFFMYIGLTGVGRAIYFFYSFFCHQLPQRSLFLFGEKTMYPLNEIQAVWQNTNNPLILRKFTGNEIMGWKIAWSDRMMAFYTSVWVFAALWFPFRSKIKLLSWWGFALLLLPMAIDGGSHTISDFSGIGLGFRDTNQWLAILTNNSFPATFYAGDALGSFNSIMRFISGLLAGLGIVWLAFPYIFQTQALDQELEKLNYDKDIEQIKNKNTHSTG